jgi:hypothetical protein
MAHSKKKAPPPPPSAADVRKGAALRRRMRTHERGEIIQAKLTEHLQYKSRAIVTEWWRGHFWPTQLEPLIEEFLEVPAGFFQAIGKGVSYEQAVHPAVLEAPREMGKRLRLSTDLHEALIGVFSEMQRLLAEDRRRAIQERDLQPHDRRATAL